MNINSAINGLHLDYHIWRRRRLVSSRRELIPVGRLHCLVFNHERMSLPRNADGSVRRVPNQNQISWMHPDFPTLWLSPDEADILVLPPAGCDSQGNPWKRIPHPPAIPDTDHFIPVDPEDKRAWAIWGPRGGARPFMVEQRYRDRTTKELRNSGFLVIEPVEQILMQQWQEGSHSMVMISPGYDGKTMSFFIDPDTGEGHLIGGKFYIDSAIRKAS